MKRLLAATVAAMALFALAAPGASAQGKKVSVKVIKETDKVKVYETTYPAGAENTGVAFSALRIVRALNGGTLERTYEDGKKQKISWKAGQVDIIEPGPGYKTKNVGKSTLKLYVVQLK
ncbi:MAG: hypothetical protein JO035_01140 [Betaproteobacteria bacterium]|nr:hypothetical protein [Betaproteobacteria bacterium]